MSAAVKPIQEAAVRPAVCQTTAIADAGQPVCAAGRTGGERKAVPSELPGSAAGRGSGGTRTQGDSAADSGGALPGSEDAGGVRLPVCAAYSGGAAAESG